MNKKRFIRGYSPEDPGWSAVYPSIWGPLAPGPRPKSTDERLDDIQEQLAELKDLVEKVLHGP